MVPTHSLTQHPHLDPEITQVAAIATAVPGSLSYVEGARFTPEMETTQASAVILPQEQTLQDRAIDQGLAWMAAPDPRLVFAQAIALFYQPFRPPRGIHPTAVIDPTAVLGAGVSVGPHGVIHGGVTVGEDVCIHANVVIYPGAQIGDRTVLHASCVIHERSRIGADCVIHCGAVVGSEGFGFVPTPTGWYKMEQSGCTVLEDGVEVGCNSSIDRPAVGETRVAQGTKIDNLVQIGHGCQVGQHSAICAQVGLAGGVTVGNQVLLAGQVGVANQARIGDGAMVAAKAGVFSHSVVAPKAQVGGYPAMPYRRWLRMLALCRQLPTLVSKKGLGVG